MKREQIIEILQDKIELSLTSNYKSVYIDGLDKCADAILALPLDVPSDEEIRYRATLHAGVPSDDPDIYGSDARKVYNECIRIGQWARGEIIERNK